MAVLAHFRPFWCGVVPLQMFWALSTAPPPPDPCKFCTKSRGGGPPRKCAKYYEGLEGFLHISEGGALGP